MSGITVVPIDSSVAKEYAKARHRLDAKGSPIGPLDLMIAAHALALGTILITNNLRDIPGDTESGKRTLAVRLGDRRTRVLYVVMVVSGFGFIVALAALTSPWTLLGLLALPWAIAPIRIVASGARGPGLIPALKSTGTLVLVTGLALGLGLGLG